MKLMNARLKLWSALAVGVVAGAVAGCQTYDFEPVEPLAIAQTTKTRTIEGRLAKPNLMFLIDKSGSMTDLIAPGRTRWDDLRSAMNTFFTAYGTVGRMGAVLYPKDNVCASPTLEDIAVHIPNSKDVDAELQAAANAINQRIQTSAVEGGTPTGNALAMLSTYPPLLDGSENRAQFIVLLTDGLPNCNAQNVNSYAVDPVACRCTLAADGCSHEQFQRLGCLDKDNSVAQVARLNAAGIKTIVIGFGSETGSGSGPEVLNAMAEVGGFARRCPDGTDAECGGGAGSCNQSTKMCAQRFYQAANGAELGKALADISISLIEKPCEYKIDDPPSDPSFLTVMVDGENVRSGDQTWKYADSTVTFVGELCKKLENSTTFAPVKIEFRIVEAL
jgi:hypothetical protein